MGTSPFDRFSQLYIGRGARAQDSPRARKRFATLVWDLRKKIPSGSSQSDLGGAITDAVHRELGVTVPYNHGYDLSTFISTCELRDFLDAITIVYRAVVDNAWTRSEAKSFIEFVSRVFDEENLSYRIDARGVVHYRVDEEYQANVSSTLGALEDPRFAAARGEFERSKQDLDKAVPDAVDATRALFAAAESVFKVVTKSNASLDAGEVKKTLGPYVDRCMSGRDTIAKGAAATLAVGFADWVNACHPYRHGHNQPDAPAPPLELTIALMSIGAGYVRWLATLDVIREKQ